MEQRRLVRVGYCATCHLPQYNLSNVIRNIKCVSVKICLPPSVKCDKHALQLIRLGESNDADGFGKQKTGVAVCVQCACDNADEWINEPSE